MTILTSKRDFLHYKCDILIIVKKYTSLLLSVFNFGSDIGVSLIILFIFSKAFDFEITNNLVLLSIAFNLLPDVDMLVEIPLVLFDKIKPNRIHQVFTHRPLIYVPIFMVLFYNDPIIGLLFFTNITLHFLHDSFGTGWGVMWLWPFNNKYYKFFSNSNGVISPKIVQVWTKNARNKIMMKYGDNDWIENLYINSWMLKNFKIKKNGPNKAWLITYYKKLRFFFLAEIILSFVGAFILIRTL